MLSSYKVWSGVFIIFFGILFPFQFCFAETSAPAGKVQRIISKTGIEIWYVQEPSIPVISVSLGFRSGAKFDSPEKSGLANFALSLLREGAGELDAFAFQKALIDRSIRFSATASYDQAHIRMQTLTKNRKDAFRLLGLALADTRFDSDAVERVRGQILNSIANAASNPQSIARERWFKQVFGEHAYGRAIIGNKDTIKNITLADLKHWVTTELRRDNIVVSVSGDISLEEISGLIDLALGRLISNGKSLIIKDALLPEMGNMKVFNMPLMQSIVVFGMPGLKRDDPDYYSAYVMNYILGGGGFISRLTSEIREKRGLVYSVYSYLSPLQHAGLLIGGFATRNNAVFKTLDLLKYEISQMASEGVTEAELLAAKQYLTGAFPLRLDTGSKIARILTQMQINHLGIDYLQKRNAFIDAVTVEDVNAVAKRLLRSERLQVIVVGEPSHADQEGS